MTATETGAAATGGPPTVLDETIEAVRRHPWNDGGLRTAHAEHDFHWLCEVCQRNVEAILAVGLRVAADRLRKQAGMEREHFQAVWLAAAELLREGTDHG